MKSDAHKNHDVLILGAGPAGLSAAMALGRLHRDVLVCDDGRPRNESSAHANNLPGHDGMHPALWRAQVRTELKKYATVSFSETTVRQLTRQGDLFEAELGSGEVHIFRKVILAHGIVDQLPDAPGFRELWGKAVFHCPYCHGYEATGQKLGFVGNGKFAEHLPPMLLALTQDLVVFTNGPSQIEAGFRTLLQQRGISVVENKIESLRYTGERLNAIVCAGGLTVEREALFVAPVFPLVMKAAFGDQLGCEKNEIGFFQVNEMQKTSVAGVFAAGDIMSGRHSVLAAAASGQMAGAGAAAELLNEDFRNPA